jgi:hypothetical protein
MATPTSVNLSDKAIGLKKGSAWNAAVALGAGDEIRVKSLTGLTRERDLYPQEYANCAFPPGGVLTNIKAPDIGFGTDLFYEMGALGRFIASIFGTAGTPTVQGATTAYKHIFQWADLITAFFTLAAEYPGIIKECPSLMPTEWNVKVASGVLQSECKGKGNLVKDDSSVNTDTQMAALTSTANILTPVLFGEAQLFMNDQSVATACTATTAWDISNIDLSFKRPLKAEYPAGSFSIAQPDQEKNPDILIKLDFLKYAAANKIFTATMDAQILQKLALVCTSRLEAGVAYYYKMTFNFPSLQIKGNPQSAEAIFKNGLELVPYEAAAAPTGMAYTRPYIELINKQTTDYLA